jgi:hypothetical protein
MIVKLLASYRRQSDELQNNEHQHQIKIIYIILFNYKYVIKGSIFLTIIVRFDHSKMQYLMFNKYNNKPGINNFIT